MAEIRTDRTGTGTGTGLDPCGCCVNRRGARRPRDARRSLHAQATEAARDLGVDGELASLTDELEQLMGP